MLGSFDSMVDFFDSIQRSASYRMQMLSFIDFLDLKPAERVLDVGCGPGGLVREIAGKASHVVGIDPSPGMIERARLNAVRDALNNVEFHLGQAERIPSEDNQFDITVATSVLFLLPDPLVCLREMVRVTKKNGTVACLNPSDKMTVTGMTRFCRSNGFSGFEAEGLLGWASEAEANLRLSRESVTGLMARLNLVKLQLLEIIDGMVLFAKGTKLEE